MSQSISPAVVRRVMRELSELENSPPEGIRIQENEEDMLDVTGIIEGPEGTPYAGGYFRVKFKFTEEFPAAPPKCWFATKIFHPNVGPTGEICVNTLKKDWKSTYGIGHILVTVKCLLIYPNPESALDEEAGKLLLEDYDSYCSRAKLITSVHATPRVKPAEFNKPSATEDETPSASSAKDGSSSTTPSVASTSKTTTTPSISVSVSVSVSPTKAQSTTPSTTFSVPVITRKGASPAPQISLKASLSSEKEGGLGAGPHKDLKERHPSPSPLGTADANVGGKPGMGVGMGMASTAGMAGITGTKAVKRAATNSATTGAEKRKKALKRL
ncbi:Ubiquitin-conjugating enzyme E2 S [Psilocybe cubensis]|uniref:Ubiquitin-conjugating enzyme E2 S n=2 Tax=Psilocybe cubensis TaxID=181762 RepID=A0ACB8GMJ9_PSICU|nr:Ubiquitin-conjugating enzyme E2 S [Psilocybe cubensis]KAH9476784.1 Ubiquitin-conjugating enzyme E2 S [Psilocybe cubensis]